VRPNQATPLIVNPWRVANENKELCDASEKATGLLWRKRESVTRRGLGRDCPQLVEVCRNDAHGVTGISERSNGPEGLFLLWMFSVNVTNKDVRIGDDVQLLVFAAVEILATQAFGGKSRNGIRKLLKCSFKILAAELLRRRALGSDRYRTDEANP
jgi:hypothetical protein